MPYKNNEDRKAQKRRWYRTERGQATYKAYYEACKASGVKRKRSPSNPESSRAWYQANRELVLRRFAERVAAGTEIIRALKSSASCPCGAADPITLCVIGPPGTRCKNLYDFAALRPERIRREFESRRIVCRNCLRIERIGSSPVTQKDAVFNKRLWLMRDKQAKGCMDCGMGNPLALDYHHRDPRDKTAAVSSFAKRGWSSMKAEIEKCDVLCANCHALRHERAVALRVE